MLWFGIAILTFAVLITLFKATVVWYACTEDQNGGVPTLDFVIFHPLYLLGGLYFVFKAKGVDIGSFGFLALYLSLTLLLGVIHYALYKIGQRVIERDRHRAAAAYPVSSVAWHGDIPLFVDPSAPAPPPPSSRPSPPPAAPLPATSPSTQPPTNVPSSPTEAKPGAS